MAPKKFSRTCDVCGDIYFRPPCRAGHFCSVECRRIGLTTPAVERFWKRVVKNPNGCWLWAGATVDGYGNFLGSDQYTVLAHRFSWELAHGPITDESLCVLHNCPTGDNRLCVNPDHLFLGTRADNSTDAIKKGQTRGAVGEANCKAKLNAQEVLKVREMYSGGATQVALAGIFGLHQTQISKIVKRKVWSHI